MMFRVRAIILHLRQTSSCYMAPRKVTDKSNHQQNEFYEVDSHGVGLEMRQKRLGQD